MKGDTLLAEKMAVEEARPNIGKKIAKQKLRLLSQGNELAPISQLPNEILGLIFIFASATRQVQLSRQFNFSHVSQRWRFVALGTPEIWCSIPFYNRKWASLVLERSKSTDLLVNANLSVASYTSFLVPLIKRVLTKHAPRIRELSFTRIPSAIFSLLLDNLEPSSLRLRSLCLQSSAHDIPSFSMGILTNPEILQNLDIERVDVDWFRLPLTTLVSLKIHYPLSRPSWIDFITALQGMPALESLYLHNSLPMASEAHRRPLNPLRLTCLRILSLHSTTDINEVLNVLSFIVVPQTTTLKLSADVTDSQFPFSALSNLTPSLSGFLSEMSSERNEKLLYQALQVCCTYGRLDLIAWRQGCLGANLTLSFSFLSGDSSAKTLQEVLPCLPVLGLVTLVLDIDNTVDQNSLLANFGNLPQLRNVTARGDGANNFLLALLHKPDDYNTCASACYFPALRSIEVRDVIFTPDRVPIHSLEDCLMERWEHNVAISKLVLSRCFSLYETDVQRLREIVVDVDWDGLEQEYQWENTEDCYTYIYNYLN